MTEQLFPVEHVPRRPAGPPIGPSHPLPDAVCFTVLGRAQPAGSKRAFALRRGGVPTGRVAVVDANPAAKTWQADVRAAAAEALERAGCDGSLLAGPLQLEVAFIRTRPAGHYGTGRNAGQLKPSAPFWPATRPDTTKLLRGLEDALSGLVWRDDAQVVVQSARKLYGEPERAEVTIQPLDPMRTGVRTPLPGVLPGGEAGS